MSETITSSTSTIMKSNFEKTNENPYLKTVRLALNMIGNVLIFFTVFVCILFACSSQSITYFHLHIIFCVLGYQLLMCQGILILSNYNGWSIYLKRRHRKQSHWILQLLAVILVLVGSVLIMCEKPIHFNTVHGSLGLSALITSLMSVLNGVLGMYAYKLRSLANIFWIKFIHYFTGIGSVLLSASCLCTGFNYHSFRIWIGNDNAVTVLMFITSLFSVIVSLEFWILIGNRLRNL